MIFLVILILKASNGISTCYKCDCWVLGLYRSCKEEDIIKYKIYHGELTDRVTKEFSAKVGFK